MRSDNLLAVPSEPTTFFDEFDRLYSRLPDNLKPIAEAFRFNLESVTRTLVVPYRVVSLALLPDLKDTMKHGVRDAWSTPAEGGLLQKVQAKADAMKAFADEFQNASVPGFKIKARERANEVLQHEELQLGVRELFLQALVLTWSAFEVLAHDLFVWWLDRAPEVSVRLLEHSESKKHVKSLRFDLSNLAREGFDLSTKIGQLVAKKYPLHSLAGIRSAYAGLLPNEADLQRTLKDKALRLLAERRNLIVHRRAVVDQSYRDTTSEDVPLGQRLEPSLDDLRSSVSLTMSTGLALLTAVAEESSDEGLPPI